MIQAIDPVLACADSRIERWRLPRWYALYTRSRHEKFLDRELQRKHLETFLPIRKVVRRWSDRRQTVEEPLFQSYLFVRIPWMTRFNILNTKGAVCFVTTGISHEPVEVPERDLLSVKRFADEDMPLDPFPYLKMGQRVYIKNGPFKGVEGFIVRKDKHCRLVISLDLLNQSVSVQIDEACVENCG